MQRKKKSGKLQSKSEGSFTTSHQASSQSTVWKVIKVVGITMFLKNPETGEVVMDYMP